MLPNYEVQVDDISAAAMDYDYILSPVVAYITYRGKTLAPQRQHRDGDDTCFKVCICRHTAGCTRLHAEQRLLLRRYCLYYHSIPFTALLKSHLVFESKDYA